MRTLLVPAAFAAVLATSAAGLAATSHHVIGTVKAFDANALTLTLDNGSTYTLPHKFKDPGLKTGEKVSLNWEMSGSKKMAEKVRIEK